MIMRTTAIAASTLQVPGWLRSIARWPDFITLTKPRVMSLAVFTAFVGLKIAPGHLDPLHGFVAILSIAMGAACTLQVAFTPVAGGPRSGTLTVTDNAPNSPQTLSLTGTGVDFALNANGATSLTIANGQNAVYPLLLSSAANVPGTATFVCSGAPANSTCNVTPASVTLGNTTTVSVTVLTGVTSAARLPRQSTIRPHVFWVVVMLPLGFLTMRGRRRSFLAGSVLLGCLLAATGCGAGRAIPLGSGSNPGPPISVTPAGTYSIVASASSAGLTRSVTLTLIVQ